MTPESAFVKAIIRIWIYGFLGLVFFGIIISFPDYCTSAEKAINLYPEIELNLLQIEGTLKTMRNRTSAVDFQKKIYSGSYRSFGISKLDADIAHFYSSMRMNRKYDPDALERMKDQGIEVLKTLDDVFCLNPAADDKAKINFQGYVKHTGLKIKEIVLKVKAITGDWFPVIDLGVVLPLQESIDGA